MPEDIKNIVPCLIIIAKHFGKQHTKESIANELSRVSETQSIDSIIECSQQLGFIASRHPFSIPKLQTSTLPAIAITNDNQAVVLSSINTAENTVMATYWNGSKKTISIPLSALEQPYITEIITLTQNPQINDQQEESGDTFFNQQYWLWSTLWRLKKFYTQVMIAALIINILALALPLFIMNVYDRVIPNKAFETLWVLAAGVAIALIFDFLLKTLRAYFVDITSKQVDETLSTLLLKKSINITMEKQPASAGIRACHLKDFESVRDFFSSACIVGLVDIPFLIIFLLIIKYIGGPIVIVTISAIILVLGFTILLSIPLYHYFKKTYAGGAKKTAMLFETLSMVELVKSTNATGGILDKWRRLTTEVAEYALKSKFFSVLASNLTGTIVPLASVTVVIVGVYLVAKNQLTTGGLIACVILTGRALAPLGQVTNLLSRVQQTRCALKSLNNVMTEEEEYPPSRPFIYRERLAPSIKFDHVSFQYPNQNGMFLEDLSLSIDEKERVAILGSMGSGKTTLCRLINGLYKPCKGEIMVGGICVPQIDPAILRRDTAYMPQIAHMIKGSARENITLGCPHATDEEVLAAAAISGADSFINHHPQGMYMPISEQGRGLSGGQAQTISLARTIIANPNILLLDEPTSSFDANLESHFISSMNNYLKNKTLILVTHKKQMLSLVDRIIVMQAGRIIIDDSKDTVLNKLNIENKAAKDHG